MIQHSRQTVTLRPGDYYMFHDYNTFKDCSFVSYYMGQEYIPLTHQNYFLKNRNFSTNLKGLIIQKPFKQSITTQYTLHNNYNGIKTWIPQNSTISKYCYYSINGTVFKEELSVELYSPSETPLYNDKCQASSIETSIYSSQDTFNIQISGMYYIDTPYFNSPWRSFNITRSINRIIGDRIPYSKFTQGTDITKLDAILYEPTGDIVDYYNSDIFEPSNLCHLNIVCYYNPLWPILFGMSIFIITLLIQVLLLYCIHRI